MSSLLTDKDEKYVLNYLNLYIGNLFDKVDKHGIFKTLQNYEWYCSKNKLHFYILLFVLNMFPALAITNKLRDMFAELKEESETEQENPYVIKIDRTDLLDLCIDLNLLNTWVDSYDDPNRLRKGLTLNSFIDYPVDEYVQAYIITT
jgi:hypothetical protein